jgi:ATP-dependent Clp endopeptidase proteolytic subunit ClpP
MARKKPEDIELFHGHDLYLPTRTLWMGSQSSSDSGLEHGESGVDHALTERMIKNLHILESTSQDAITIYLNNPGGSWYDGMAIYDAIKNSKCHITVKVYGAAMSMAAVITQAADHRIISPNARLMLHYGVMGFEGHAKDFEKWAKENEKLSEDMENIFLKRIREKQPAFSPKKLASMLDHDTILSAHEAVQLGLMDEVEERTEE